MYHYPHYWIEGNEVRKPACVDAFEAAFAELSLIAADYAAACRDFEGCVYGGNKYPEEVLCVIGIGGVNPNE